MRHVAVGSVCKNFVADLLRLVVVAEKRIMNVRHKQVSVLAFASNMFSSDASLLVHVRLTVYKTVVLVSKTSCCQGNSQDADMYYVFYTKVEIARYATRPNSLMPCYINAVVHSSICRMHRPLIHSSFRTAHLKRSMCACV